MKYEIIVDVNQENKNESSRKILISSRTFEQVNALLVLADILEDGKQFPDPAERPQDEPQKDQAATSEEDLKKMIGTFEKALEFTEKKGGLEISSSKFANLAEIEPKIDALLYAYGYGYRRGYNKAADQKK